MFSGLEEGALDLLIFARACKELVREPCLRVSLQPVRCRMRPEGATQKHHRPHGG
jgi:hypothetical protein